MLHNFRFRSSELRRTIVAHMRTIPFLESGTGPDGNRNYLVTYDGGYHSVDDYLASSDMAENGVWALGWRF